MVNNGSGEFADQKPMESSGQTGLSNDPEVPDSPVQTDKSEEVFENVKRNPLELTLKHVVQRAQFSRVKW